MTHTVRTCQLLAFSVFIGLGFVTSQTSAEGPSALAATVEQIRKKVSLCDAKQR